MSIDKALDWIIPHIIAESERRLADFPIGQRVQKLDGGWKWRGAVATIVGHKRTPIGTWQIQVRFDVAELEAYNLLPWGPQVLDMTEFEPMKGES